LKKDRRIFNKNKIGFALHLLASTPVAFPAGGGDCNKLARYIILKYY